MINYLTQNIKLTQKSTTKGVGDDAAVLDFEGKKTLISTDLLLEGIHFDLAYTPLKHLGYKAIQVNLSDIYAMNARPKQVTVSLAISSRYTVEALDELYQGIKIACKHYGVDLVGGDTTSSLKGLAVRWAIESGAKDEEVSRIFGSPRVGKSRGSAAGRPGPSETEPAGYDAADDREATCL